MLRYITGRMVLTIPVLFGVSVIVFLLAHLVLVSQQVQKDCVLMELLTLSFQLL